MRFTASCRVYGLIASSLLTYFYASECAGTERVSLWVKKPYVIMEISGAITRADNDIQLRRIKRLESSEKISTDQFFSEVKSLRKKSQTGN